MYTNLSVCKRLCLVESWNSQFYNVKLNEVIKPYEKYCRAHSYSIKELDDSKLEVSEVKWFLRSLCSVRTRNGEILQYIVWPWGNPFWICDIFDLRCQFGTHFSVLHLLYLFPSLCCLLREMLFQVNVNNIISYTTYAASVVVVGLL